MERAALSLSATPAVVFADGLGERRLATDPTGREPSEWLCLRHELAAVPSFEFALRERVSRLGGFRHPAFARARTVERLNDPDATLALVSDRVAGVRASELLSNIESFGLPLDINTGLCLMRQLAGAVAALHESARDAAHGALGPERVILTPDARLVVTEYACGTALEQLRFSQERYWTELRVALPRSAGPARFDQRADVLQVGIVALSFVVGRLLHDEEFPARLGDVLGSTWAVSARGGFEPLPAGLRGWFGRALQLDARNAFANAIDARDELERVLGDGDRLASPASLATFLAKYQEQAGDFSAAPIAPTPFAAAAPIVESPRPIVEPRPVVEPPRPVPIAVLIPPVAKPIDEPRFGELAAAGIASASTLMLTTTPAKPHVDPVRVPPPLAEPLVAAVVSGLHAAHHDHDERRDGVVPEIHAGHVTGAGSWQKPAAIAAALVVLLGGGAFAAHKMMAPAVAVSHTGTLVITSNPSGAATIVDGEARGMTPITLTLAAGEHAVELRSSGGLPRTMSVSVGEGTQTSQYIELPKNGPTVGQLQVRTDPPGADVTIDGVPHGRTPALVGELTAGEHAVVLTSDLGTMKQTVTIEAGTTASLVVPLGAAEGAPLSGWISIGAPIELQVFEKDKLLGTSETDRIMVSAGKHDLDLVNDTLGFRATKTVQVAAGKTSPIKIDLPKGTIALNATPWAEVWIDGEKAGETPIGNVSLTIGPHDVVFRHPDLGEQHHTAIVTLKEPARLSVDLRKK